MLQEFMHYLFLTDENDLCECYTERCYSCEKKILKYCVLCSHVPGIDAGQEE